MNLPELPTFYYLDNFLVMVRFSFERYRDFLDESELGLVASLLDAPRLSQALFVRCFNRKGRLFDLDRLSYDELAPVPKHLPALLETGLATRSLDDVPTETMLASLTVARLKTLLGSSAPDKRASLVQVALDRPELRGQIIEGWDWIDLCSKPLFLRLQTLFFCSWHLDMSEFVLVDLGRACFEAVELSPGSRFFRDRNHLETYLAVGAQADLVHEWVAARNAEALRSEFERLLKLWVPDQPWTRTVTRMLFHSARSFEWGQQWEEAVEAYRKILRLTPDFKVACRLILCLEKLGEHKTALDDLDMLPIRLTRSRQLFIRFHINKNRKKLGLAPIQFEPMRRAPCAEQSLARSHEFIGSKAGYVARDDRLVTVEQAVLEEFIEEGFQGVLAENGYFQTIAVMLAWEVMFLPLEGVFQHPFQSAPLDYRSESFFPRREAQFTKLRQQLRGLDTDSLCHLFLGRYRQKAAIRCVMNHAARFDPQSLLPFLRHCGGRVVGDLVWEFFRHQLDLRRGFPDLAIWRDDEFKLIEVKGPGDRLSEHQRVWHHVLLTHGLEVELRRISTAVGESCPR